LYTIGIVSAPAGLSPYQEEALLAVVREHDKMRKYYVLHMVPALSAELQKAIFTPRQFHVEIGSRCHRPDDTAQKLIELCDEVYVFPNRRTSAARPDYATKVYEALISAGYVHARIARTWLNADMMGKPH